MHTYEFELKPKQYIIGGIIAFLFLLCMLTVGWYLVTDVDNKLNACNAETQLEKKACLASEKEIKQNLKELQSERDKLYADNQTMQLRNTVYIEILRKWRLPVPNDCEIEQFNISDYLCETWCPWYKTELPKVREDYKKSDCPCCDCSKVRRQKKAPPPPPYTPPPEPPKAQWHVGPTATCPKPNNP